MRALIGAWAGVAVVLAVSAPAAALPLASLPVVRCPTVLGVPSDTVPATPRSLVAATGPLSNRLSFYSNGRLTLLGPRGWHCVGLFAADGGLALTVLPPYVSAVPPAQAPTTSAAVSAEEPSAGTGNVAFPACRFFPEARTIDSYDCPLASEQIPAGEHVYRLSAHAVAFEDPPGVTGTGSPSGAEYPANGVVTFNGVVKARKLGPRKWQLPEAAFETCTLPQSDHSLCTAILNDFLNRYPL